MRFLIATFDAFLYVIVILGFEDLNIEIPIVLLWSYQWGKVQTKTNLCFRRILLSLYFCVAHTVYVEMVLVT